MQLIAQAVDVIVANPPVESLRSWWPVIVTVAAGLWSWWQSYQANKWQVEAKDRATKLDLETQRLKMEYEQRKEFVDDLMEECQKLRSECEKQRDENQKLRLVITERDISISNMRQKIQVLEEQLAKLQLEVESLEKTRDRNGQV